MKSYGIHDGLSPLFTSLGDDMINNNKQNNKEDWHRNGRINGHSENEDSLNNLSSRSLSHDSHFIASYQQLNMNNNNNPLNMLGPASPPSLFQMQDSFKNDDVNKNNHGANAPRFVNRLSSSPAGFNSNENHQSHQSNQRVSPGLKFLSSSPLLTPLPSPKTSFIPNAFNNNNSNNIPPGYNHISNDRISKNGSEKGNYSPSGSKSSFDLLASSNGKHELIQSVYDVASPKFIKVTIPEYSREKDSNDKPFTSFHIKVNVYHRNSKNKIVFNNSWVVKKRYRQFYSIHNTLNEFLDDKALTTTLKNGQKDSTSFPKLPSKKWLGSSLSSSFVEERRQQLEIYLNRLLKINEVWKINEFIDFIDNENIIPASELNQQNNSNGNNNNENNNSNMISLSSLPQLSQYLHFLEQRCLSLTHSLYESQEVIGRLCQGMDQLMTRVEEIERGNVLTKRELEEKGYLDKNNDERRLKLDSLDATEMAEDVYLVGNNAGNIHPYLSQYIIQQQRQREREMIVMESERNGLQNIDNRILSDDNKKENLEALTSLSLLRRKAELENRKSNDNMDPPPGLTGSDEQNNILDDFDDDDDEYLGTRPSIVRTDPEDDEALRFIRHTFGAISENRSPVEKVRTRSSYPSTEKHEIWNSPGGLLFRSSNDPRQSMEEPLPVNIIPLSSSSKNFHFVDEHINELLEILSPNSHSEIIRTRLFSFISMQIKKTLGAQTFAIGPWAMKCCLPDDKIQVSAFICSGQENTWFIKVNEALCKVNNDVIVSNNNNNNNNNSVSAYILKNINYFNEKDLQYLKCIISDVTIDILSNSLNDLALVSLVEKIDQLPTTQKAQKEKHLLKRSILLIKAWWKCETASYTGANILELIDDSALITMILCVYSYYHSVISSPIQLFSYFLSYYSTFDWQREACSVFGPISLDGIEDLKVWFSPFVENSRNPPLITVDMIEEYLIHQSSDRDEERNTNDSDVKERTTSREVDPSNINNISVEMDRVSESSGISNASATIHDISPLSGLYPSVEFEKAVMNIIHPFDPSVNLVTDAFTRSMVEQLQQIIYSAARHFSFILRKIMEFDNNKNESKSEENDNGIKTSVKKLIEHFFSNTWKRYKHGKNSLNNVSIPPPFQFHNSSEDANELSTLARQTFSNEDIFYNRLTILEERINFCSLLLKSEVTESALKILSKEILLDRGSLPVGEIGKLLQESTSNPSLSSILKEKFGGLKKFLEKYPDDFFLTTDHPFNPHVYLTTLLNEEDKLRLLKNGTITSNKNEPGSGKKSKKGNKRRNKNNNNNNNNNSSKHNRSNSNNMMMPNYYQPQHQMRSHSTSSYQGQPIHNMHQMHPRQMNPNMHMHPQHMNQRHSNQNINQQQGLTDGANPYANEFKPYNQWP